MQAKLCFSLLLLMFCQSLISDSAANWPSRDENGLVTPLPKGEVCIAPASEMRKTHMNMLLHKRDQTVHDGIRTKHASLVECINCHVTEDKNGQVARITSKQHFCQSCHVAVSVKIDCFECHADRPAEMFSGLINQGNLNSLSSYHSRTSQPSDQVSQQ